MGLEQYEIWMFRPNFFLLWFVEKLFCTIWQIYRILSCSVKVYHSLKKGASFLVNFSSGDREVVWDTRCNVVLFFNPDNYCLPHFFSICRFALLNVFSFFFVHIDKRTKLEFSIFTMKKSFFNKCVIANTFAWRYLLWSFIPWLCPAVITSSYQKVFLWEDENIISKSR